jgi:hypothetical protein
LRAVPDRGEDGGEGVGVEVSVAPVQEVRGDQRCTRLLCVELFSSELASPLTFGQVMVVGSPATECHASMARKACDLRLVVQQAHQHPDALDGHSLQLPDSA